MQFQPPRKALAAVGVSSVLAMAASTVAAAEPAELTVKGTIIPSACSASFSGGGVADFGTIKVADLKLADYNDIGTRSVTLTLNCQTKKQASFTVTDLRGGATPGADFNTKALKQDAAHAFGLGTAAIDGKTITLGGYAIKMEPGTYDGKSAAPIYFAPRGSFWGINDVWKDAADLDHTGVRFGMGRAALINPVVYDPGGTYDARVTTYPLTIRAALNKGGELQIAQETPLDGQAVFNISYK